MSGVFSAKVFSSDFGGRKSEVFSSEVGGRTRERDGGLQPPIERLVYICRYSGVRRFKNFRVAFASSPSILDTVIKFEVRSSRSLRLSSNLTIRGGSGLVSEVGILDTVGKSKLPRLPWAAVGGRNP